MFYLFFWRHDDGRMYFFTPLKRKENRKKKKSERCVGGGSLGFWKPHQKGLISKIQIKPLFVRRHLLHTIPPHAIILGAKLDFFLKMPFVRY